MEVTEYWATLVSIIIGLGIADLLVNLHRLIHDRKRVAWDPLPLLWAIVALLWMINYWWAVATNIDGSRYVRVVGQYVLLAVSPILLFMMSASVLPRSMPAEGRLDMKTEWASSRPIFFICFGLNQIVAWIVISVVRQSIVWDLAAIVRTSVLGMVVLLLFAKSRRLEWFGVVAVLLVMSIRLTLQPVQ